MPQLAKEYRLPPHTPHASLQRILLFFLTGTFLRVYSRPEGAPALCDDPSELGQPPGIHLKPLQWVIPASTPGPIVEVIFIEASLWAKNTFLFSRSIWSSPSPHRYLTLLDCQKSIVHFRKLFYTFQDKEKLDIYSVPMSLCVKISSLLHLIKDFYFCVVVSVTTLFCLCATRGPLAAFPATVPYLDNHRT